MKEKKEHVAMERNICLVTGKEYETGAVLLATRYNGKTGEPVVDLAGHNDRTGFDHAVTGNGFCPEVQKKFDKGYIALVVVDAEKSEGGETMKPEDAYRTGEVIYVKREKAEMMLTRATVDTFAFIDEEAADKIKVLHQELKNKVGKEENNE